MCLIYRFLQKIFDYLQNRKNYILWRMKSMVKIKLNRKGYSEYSF